MIELKHLSAYLPYELKAIDTRTKEIRTVAWTHFTYDLKYVGMNHLLCEGLIISDHKPILRPMSDLFMTDEDLSCDLMDIVMDCDQYCDAYGEWHESYVNNPEPIRLLQAPYEVFEELVKQMYDVYDLIGQGLAISIHDLEK